MPSKRFIPALAGVAAFALLSGCVIRDGNYDRYEGGHSADNYGYGGAYGRDPAYGGYAYDPYDGYSGYGGYRGYGYPNYGYYATPFTTFALGLGLGYYDFGGFGFRGGYGGYRRGNGGGWLRGGSRGAFRGR